MATPDPAHVLRLAAELHLQVHQVAATAQLLADAATVPFIARYRKEATGELDEVQVAAIRDRLEQLRATDERRATILASLKERNLLTAALEQALAAADTLTALEDIYLPFRPKKRTRATIAKEKGLEPLADLLFAQDPATDPLAAAQPYAGRAYVPDDGKNQPAQIASTDEALAGARDILAERISDDKDARARLRALYQRDAELSSKVLPGKETEAAKYKDYFEWREPLAKAPSHRVLAIRRGEKELFLMMRVTLPDETLALAELEPLFLKNASSAPVGGVPSPRSSPAAPYSCADHVRLAVQDSCKRLLAPAMETEMRLDAKKRADEAAIRVFTANVRELLLAAPLGQRAVLAIDPGFRTGCKVVLLDRQGKLLHNDVVFPDRHPDEAREKLLGFIQHFHVESVAIGNGTAGRETETFVRTLGLPPAIPIVMVNESGASIYSASDVAREEFPDHDLTVRGAVSIGRRLMDPLAELVKLDPKSIGVGQYQHDVDQLALKRSLDDTVVSSVNAVGVELNTASKQLLSYVSGLNAATAAAIVARRNEKGPFASRAELRDVPRLGPKAFEQAAGFLRIRDAAHPLDASAVHPERYALVEQMAADLGATVADLMRDAKLRAQLDLTRYVTADVGLPTLTDIVAELAKPGRDPRERFETFSFAAGVNRPEDLTPGQRLPGLVTNVTDFGAFVDIGVHQDGLVHVSQLADTFVKDPATIVKPGQRVNVTVVEIDLARKRIALSMRSKVDLAPRAPRVGGAAAPRATSGAARGGPSAARPASPAAPRPPQSLNADWFSAALNKKP
ncbi:RNA-binding transcriptional accessory protein [Horticoccus luteus]|uniref:RNA-binding transcriptional accessory protein n=1 Tax=Horticoccus luteus TaxID=2862869 RepID=A0A8F9TVQ7_9BACT|nr:Tex family protein [Horticoccus luteus]QYM78648.1 RNA-binding transcriptional accessory protein [Horticoccus luteus]